MFDKMLSLEIVGKIDGHNVLIDVNYLTNDKYEFIYVSEIWMVVEVFSWESSQ